MSERSHSRPRAGPRRAEQRVVVEVVGHHLVLLRDALRERVDVHRRLAQVARPLRAGDHDRERAVGLEAVVEEAQRLGDPARVHVLLAGQRLVAHGRVRVAVRVLAERERDVREVVAGVAVLVHRPAGQDRDLVDRPQQPERPAPLLVPGEPLRHLGPRPARLRGALARPPRDRDLALARSRPPSPPGRRRRSPAPPPYPTWQKNVMSPRPTLRATSTSRPSSIENIARPSTSAGCRPASSIAMLIAWHASDSSVSARPLPNAVWPMPTTAVRSLRGASSGTRCDAADRRARYQPFHSGRRFSIIAAMRSLPSSVSRFSSM